MSRHNRRRSRGGRKHAPKANATAMSDDGLLATNLSLYNAENGYSRFSTPSPVSDFVDRIPQLPASKPLPRGAPPSARVWHNRYMAWQARKQIEEQMARESLRANLAVGCFGPGADVRRFSAGGSDSGSDLSDDEADQELEAKMMDYFHGLDWLD